MPVVVVESPAKAKTINKYLGDSFTVLASYGHVRDLPPKEGSVDTENDFEMKWEIAGDGQKHIRAIAAALKNDDRLILATDPDREGEAISWHLEEVLREKNAIKGSTKVERVVFNAITKDAVTTAMKNPREVDMELVQAYLARRALDYLVGFNLSPVLWRKLPGAKSAGRVQSVCLRLIVEREMQIEAFKPREYWSIKAILSTERGEEFEARLTKLDGRPVDKFDLATGDAAASAVAKINAQGLSVAKVVAKPVNRNPSPPFMTSTLQQEASRKHGMGARDTMYAAQRLYEAGYITYMRTDGIDMAPEAVAAVRETISSTFGANYLPKQSRNYKNKAKNAQEAHECIRPTNVNATPESLSRLETSQRNLYELIWKRTISSQMEAARREQTSVDIVSPDGQIYLRATGQVVLFDGFMRVYEEGRDDVPDGEDTGDTDKSLPALKEGEQTAKRTVTPNQHFTQPPPRFTEATLVKQMEELGIGRPSTYASIVTTIQGREYVRKEKGRLKPEDKGRLVVAFLENYFRQYVGYDFTANLEEQLDDISGGRENYKAVLKHFWNDFSAAIGQTAELRITEVLEKINEVLAPHLFPPTEDGTDPRICKTCGNGRLSMRTARSGSAFIGCSNYPECRFTRPLANDAPDNKDLGPDGKLLGVDDNNDPITLRTGRFGFYVQRRAATDDEPKPPRASLPKDTDIETVDLKLALDFLSLPRSIGEHPDGGEITTSIGPYGPYVMWQMPKEAEKKTSRKIYANFKDPLEAFTIGMNRAVELIAEKIAKGGGRSASTPIKELGEHPIEGGAVNVMSGKYGPYVKWEKTNATLPRNVEPEDVTLEEAVVLIEARVATKGKKKAAKKKPSKKKAVKKKTAKKKKSEASPKVAAVK